MDKTAEARKALEAALTAREHAVWPHGIDEDHGKARALLAELAQKGGRQGHASLP
jgi:hypothetical protein